jgi:hypothetical protein
MEKATRRRRYHKEIDRMAASRLAEDRNVAGITAERRDVSLDPPQSRNLVHQSEIGLGFRRPFTAERWVSEEPKPTEPVVDRYHHDALSGEAGALIKSSRCGSIHQTATVNPEHHRQR